MRKTDSVQINARHGNTEHALTANLACIFHTFCLLEEMKDKCAAIKKANYYENYHIITSVLQNCDTNLKRLLWNGFGKS